VNHRQLLLGLAAVACLALPLRHASAADPAVERMFRAKCAACHGADGKGATKQGEKMKISDLTSAAFKKQMTADKIKATILDGINRDKDGVKQEMKPLRGKITDEQVEQLIAYVQGLK
jgi:mono/diheme cytochrome c family protein